MILPINHYLVGTENTTLESIERVYSRPQALMQCSKFLNRHGSWQQIGAANTAVAAKKILNENDPTQAAICSEHAAEEPMDLRFWKRRSITITIILPDLLW